MQDPEGGCCLDVLWANTSGHRCDILELDDSGLLPWLQHTPLLQHHPIICCQIPYPMTMPSSELGSDLAVRDSTVLTQKKNRAQDQGSWCLGAYSIKSSGNSLGPDSQQLEGGA